MRTKLYHSVGDTIYKALWSPFQCRELVGALNLFKVPAGHRLVYKFCEAVGRGRRGTAGKMPPVRGHGLINTFLVDAKWEH